MSKVLIKKRVEATRWEYIVATNNGDVIFRNGDLVVEVETLLDEELIKKASDLFPHNKGVSLIIVDEIGDTSTSYEGMFTVIERRHSRKSIRLATLRLQLLSKAGNWRPLKSRPLTAKI